MGAPLRWPFFLVRTAARSWRSWEPIGRTRKANDNAKWILAAAPSRYRCRLRSRVPWGGGFGASIAAATEEGQARPLHAGRPATERAAPRASPPGLAQRAH